MKTTNKPSIRSLIDICFQRGLRDIVFSPGSRNAPLVIGFNADDRFTTYCIPDERVAAFFALGISLKKQIPCMLCCTSGSAALNYAPAICEAYYQNIPLLVLTADRPENKIDQGVGQSMRQKDVYVNYVNGSYQISSSIDAYALSQNMRIVNEAISLSFSKNGPVHINVPLLEPLYLLSEHISETHHLNTPIDNTYRFTLDHNLKDIYLSSKKKIVIVGQSVPIDKLQDLLSIISNREDIVLLTETCANIYTSKGIQCIDRVLTGVSQNEEMYRPDLLIYIGGQIISKKIIRYFTDLPADKQWYINPDKVQDTFESLTNHIATDTLSFVESLVELDSPNLKSYNDQWHELNDRIRINHKSYFDNIAYSDLAVFNYLLAHIPDNNVLHVSNSSAIRYVQLFDQRKDLVYNANRGVSGIDGSTSTAMGYSHASKKQNIFITGDISFFYDSNAFWHPHQPNNLKVILINNSGGGIFRIIDGPSTSEHLEQFFEAHHELKAEKFADTYGLEYFKAEDMESLSSVFPEFINSSNPNIQLLEVITPRTENSEVLKDYFKAISKLS
jgi:2-succinyl-5-enolpyruvyl-6-hydroxy-3-cyclohexene-1-carboxylate synthase